MGRSYDTPSHDAVVDIWVAFAAKACCVSGGVADSDEHGQLLPVGSRHSA
jgi:hypothetical protein